MVDSISQTLELINDHFVHTVIEVLNLEVDVSDLVTNITTKILQALSRFNAS